MRPQVPATFRPTAALLLVAGALGALTACADPSQPTLSESVGAAFAPCQESEIKFLSTKHNFQHVFEPCGNNEFMAYTWSPDGSRIYFQLGQTGYVMDAVAPDKAVTTVPTPSPIGAGGWVARAQLALPVGPEQKDGKNRLALFDMDQSSVYYRDVPHAVVERAWAAPEPGRVLLVVSDGPEAPRQLLSMDLADGALSPAYPWLEAGFDSFSITPAAQVATVGRAGTVRVHGLADGAVKHTFPTATRGVVHGEGRWLALEHEGEPISVFYQRAWDDMTEAQRNRERQRAEKIAENLPEGSPTEVRPPSFSIVDLQDESRFLITSFHGSNFEWYEPSPYYGSFLFWGYEGKQFRRNVMLGQMGGRLRAIETNREHLGVEPMNEAARTRKAAPPVTAPSNDPPPPVPTAH